MGEIVDNIQKLTKMKGFENWKNKRVAKHLKRGIKTWQIKRVFGGSIKDNNTNIKDV